ncbi:glycoside hydrolase family 30 beta sandwich domain-containing protein [uncultured Eudoraea sp.]|uniref:glycoside hydrolase family 30 protein n=1 Tax=uncultured Eudoraea sp. TaxID=1035614 RepID=UPI00260D4F6A|nr:glycoside hydrolase family 30 beta sandwich domain-containing protein [uncultured Eudoraea sp.]
MSFYLIKKSGLLLTAFNYVLHKTYILFASFVILSVLLNCKGQPGSEDTLPKATLFSTSLDKSELLNEIEILENKVSDSLSVTSNIALNPSITYQEMDGFGYTLTGGSSIHLKRMNASARTKVLEELFGKGPNSIGVSYLRISIGASDLDEYTWSYNDLPPGKTDPDLEHFSLAYDTLYLIPVLKEILKISPKIKIMGSPWSPPPWMKDNKDTRGGSLMKEYYPAYANYFVKYIKAMEAEGIPIDAITVQNEPLHPGNNPSLLMLAKDQGEFVKNHLGPAFRKNEISTKIVIYDHNADRPDYPISILDDSLAAQYIDGSAFHLYGGTIDALSEVHNAHPDKHLYFTEQWIGAPGNFEENLSWHMENLIIGAPRNWSRNVLQWNLAADKNQEPHTDRGGCTRCLGAITIQGDSITRNPAYYIIAHASKFVPPGSVRIDSNQEGNILNVAYTTPDNKTVVILQNKNNKRVTVELKKEEEKLQITLGEKDVGTLVWN